jgi:SAM-dependent methyltransferase
MMNIEFWNNEGVQKVFTHPLCSQWLTCVDRTVPILDLGCGYGRLTPELVKEGFTTLSGYDFSKSLIKRAIHENPGASYTNSIEALTGKSFGLVLCFALFTSCPSVSGQSELAALIDEFTPGGALLYLSDYETDDNPHYNERYEEQELNTYGCFKSGTAIFRHHTAGHFDTLFSKWRKLRERTLMSKTLNGNQIRIHQYLYTKP